MNYLEAKTVLLKDNPRIPLSLVAIEIAALVCVAAMLVRIFA
jgi:hypothetical protein